MKSTPQEALNRATQFQSFMNYDAIIRGFLDMGIAPQDIKPRENIFTFNAWKAKGRIVSKGQHGVKVCTWVTTEDKESGKERKFPRTTTVFHESQTEAMQ